MTFVLHPQLEAETAPITDWPLCRVLLMNDTRFPWLILVPRREAITELHDLNHTDSATLMQEIVRATRSLQRWAEVHGGCAKINVAMIGNIVPQLHVHVVARRKTDSAWPYAVWGRGTAMPFTADALQGLAKQMSRALI
jgi:diadenosine tetraphosphate (Ap4A) HIT family hydrolase